MLSDKSKYRILRQLLVTLIEIAKSSYPNEFSAVLRYSKKKKAISEFMPLPGSLAGERSATLALHMLPIDYSVIGSVHSHPGPSCEPSGEDLYFFEKFGLLHIIICYPYDMRSWQAYDFRGNKIELEVV